MVTLLVVEVLELFVVPVQLSTAHPAAGAAVKVIVSPETYDPAVQPGEFVGSAVRSAPVPAIERVSE